MRSLKAKSLVLPFAIAGLFYISTYFLIARVVNDLTAIGLPGRFSYLPYKCGIYGDPPGRDEGTALYKVLRLADWTMVGLYYPVWAIDHYVFNGPVFVK